METAIKKKEKQKQNEKKAIREMFILCVVAVYHSRLLYLYLDFVLGHDDNGLIR